MLFPISLALFMAIAQEQAPPPKPAVNAVCPVMGGKVTEKSKIVVVRGQEYRICCPPCSKKLENEPDKYLNPDGSLKNEKKEK
jgi:YHS domain-containing protein